MQIDDFFFDLPDNKDCGTPLQKVRRSPMGALTVHGLVTVLATSLCMQ